MPAKKMVIAKPTAKATLEKDWRPETYTVKKGDTLYSIGLQYGYDYKEIAQNNNISPPYTIRLGQQLKLKEAKGIEGKPFESKVVPVNSTLDGDVVIAPLKTDSTASTQSSVQPVTGGIEPKLISEPKALREPYSEQALLAKTSVVKPVVAQKTPDTTKALDTVEPTKPADTAKIDSPKLNDDDVDWAWPTTGKVITTFNADSNSKGIDIAGSTGQAVNAAAPGKVIYSGSDLRGYGKLVIIKHNKTYLSVYAYNSKIIVKEGDTVAKGQKIAEMGNTDTDSVKLHFEIRQQGKSIDPAKYLPAN